MYEDISTVNKLYILITPDSDLYYFIRASLAKLHMYGKNLFWVMAANTQKCVQTVCLIRNPSIYNYFSK